MRHVCIILGGGGHARVLIDCLQAAGDVRIFGILEPDRSRWGQMMLGVPITGGDEQLTHLAGREINCFVVGLGAVGDNDPRRRLFEFGLDHGIKPLTVQHPAAICSRAATIGEGSQLLPGCIVNAGATLGVNVIVNSGALVEHDCVIGDHVHIASSATLASAVRVEAGAHVGAGAVIRQCITIGAGAIIGAGAVVVKNVPPHVTVAGVPARLLEKTK